MIRAEFFKELTWGDLIAWAGKDTVAAGRRIQLEGRVKQLSITHTDGLLAWVDDEDLYATRVEYDGSEFFSECSCNPIRNACDHSIAVIIEYIVSLKQRKSLPTAEETDRRFFLL
jgi:uncharacterized Zn finger protein